MRILDRIDYVNCCGAYEFGQFPTFASREDRADVRVDLAVNTSAFDSAILASDQKGQWNATLLKAGFKLMGSSINPGTENRLYFYLRINNPRRRRNS